MKIGITGWRGFIGSNFIAKNYSEYDILLYKGKFDDQGEFDKFVLGADIIIHFANAHRSNKLENKKNNEGIQSIIINSLSKIDKSLLFINLSSNQIYRNPNTQFSKMKKSMMNELDNLMVKNEKLKMVHIIAPNIYGKGGKPFYNSAISTLSWCMANSRLDLFKIINNDEFMILHVNELVDMINEIVKNYINNIKIDNIIKIDGELINIKSIRTHIKNGTRNDFNEIVEYFTEANKHFQHPSIKARHTNLSGEFQELLHKDETEFGQLSVLKIIGDKTRGKHYHIRKKEWFAVVQGSVLIEIFTNSGKYKNTFYLSDNEKQFFLVDPPYFHQLRNINCMTSQVLIVANEVYSSNNPDTYIDLLSDDEIIINDFDLI